MTPKIPTFIHSGDVGDVIYALPALRHMSPMGFNLILGTKTKTRRPFDDVWVANVASLLSIQTYINRVWKQSVSDRWDFDCDPFRKLLINNWRRGKNITSYVCDLFRVPYECSNQPWITIDMPLHVEGRPVCVNRTQRYRNHRFPWHRVYNAYRDKMFFVGTVKEYDDFQSKVGPLPYCETPTLLDVARLIAGSKLFIGNQSVSYAIAEGLKHPTVQEADPKLCDCIWYRRNAHIGHDQYVELPTIT